MGLTLLTERREQQIGGVLSCWDRMLVFGKLPKICYAEGMTWYLYARPIRIFDSPRFAKSFRDQLKQNAERLASENGLTVEFLRKRNIRKEDRVKQVLATRGEHPGLVCILSVMEPCSTYKPWHNKQTGKTYLVADDGKCLHTTSISSMNNWDCATCGFRHGCRAGCRSISTGTTGWQRSCAN